jgi:hypothetical protein
MLGSVKPACSSRVIVPRSPEERSPRPRGPDWFSPTGGSCRRAALTAAEMWESCQRISSLTAFVRFEVARPAALAAYAAALRACAPICGMALACPAARAAAAAAGSPTSRAAPPFSKRRRISSATPSSPRAKARVRAIASRGRLSPGACASNSPSTRSAQSAAQAATTRRSASLSVCGDLIPGSCHVFRRSGPESARSGLVAGLPGCSGWLESRSAVASRSVARPEGSV